MRRFVLFLLLMPFVCFAQQNLKEIRKSSWQTQAYRVSASDVESFLKWDSIPVCKFENVEPDTTFYKDNIDRSLLGIGNFVLINVIDNKLRAELVNNSDLILLAINNKDRLQLDVRDTKGVFIENAKIYINGKKAKYNNESKTYWVKQRKVDMANVIVYAFDDTLYKKIELKDEIETSISKQRKRNYKQSKIYKILSWVPSKLKKIGRKNVIKYNIGARGYIIFNQPKYKPFDTLKFKAYIVNRNWKQYKEDVDLFINYYNKNKSVTQFIQTIKPLTAGAYVGQFTISDTLPLDTRYAFELKTSTGKKIIANDFKIEDYVLDEIGTYKFISEKDIYYRNDSIRFFANAKDANGLNLLDGNTSLLLTTNKINKFYADTVFVRDTIYFKQLKLNSTTDTKFIIDPSIFPKANLDIDAKLTFKNANNEMHIEQKKIEFKYFSKEVIVSQINDSIKAVYMENGVSKSVKGELEIDFGNTIKISFPYINKIDPIAMDYSFSIDDNVDVYKDFEIEKNYSVTFLPNNNRDTLGFILNNTHKIPVYFTVFDGQKIIATSKSSMPEIKWHRVIKKENKMYKLRWQYIWAGEEKTHEESIGLYFKRLEIKVDAKEMVFPGQKDSLKISVTDYRGRPASNVNLTAVGYNNQFKNDIKVKEPPYLAKYKSRDFLERELYEVEDLKVLEKNYSLGKNAKWIKKLSIDTILYYNLLFPKNGFYDAATRIGDFIPQISVNIVDNGVPQEIYLLYLNKNLAYYNGVTEKMNYSYNVYPGIVQIGIRTKNKFIEIDSVYIQPNYKHDISFDINNLPKHSKIIEAKRYWSLYELNLLENSIWQMQNDYKNNIAYLWQGENLVHLNGNREHIVGPFALDSLQFFSPSNFDIKFRFEPGYQYKLSKSIIRLEKKPLFAKKDTSNILVIYSSSKLVLGDTIAAPPTISYPQQVKNKVLNETNFSYSYKYYASKFAGKGRIKYTSHKDSIIKYLVLFNIDSNNVELVIDANGGFVNNLRPGIYNLLLVSNNFYTATINNIRIYENGTTCLDADSVKYYSNNEIIEKLLFEVEESLKQKVYPILEIKTATPEIKAVLMILEKGKGAISGLVFDEKTNIPIPYCAVRINGYNVGAACDANGNFILKGLPEKVLVVEFSAVGYKTKSTKVKIIEGQEIDLKIGMSFSSATLNDVVIVSGALGMQKRSLSVGYSTAKISNSVFDNKKSMNVLQGKVSGVIINEVDNFKDIKINLRGIRSLTGNSNPIIVIDGIINRALKLSDLNPNDLSNLVFLKSTEAIALYGNDGVDGAIIITTKNKIERKSFRDYSFWKPNFFTNKNGKSTFEIEYPDNVTSWNTYIVAMDKKRRVGKVNFITQAYKPILAQLNLPQFLLQGDTSFFVGKTMNHTTDNYNTENSFLVNGVLKNTTKKIVAGNDANIEQLLVVPTSLDTISAKYTLQTTTGFKDAEERKIPIFQKGLNTSVGNFWVFKNDTSVAFNSIEGKTEINFYAQNNTLDVLLQEIEHLKNYPYACMEQTVSKLTGLVMEKRIDKQLNKTFNNKKIFDVLLQKVQKAQLFNGGWPWWENGKANLNITNYVLNALLIHRENTLVETNIRNGFLYLQNQLPSLSKNQLLSCLYTLSNGKHDMDYSKWFDKLNFDSLTQHEQWQCLSIMQQQKFNYEKELKKIINKKTTTMLGGIHWGDDNYSWYSNDIATTVIAYNVLKNEPLFKNLAPTIVQYFLEKRKRGYWTNTVESASILNTILPDILESQKNFTDKAVVKISGDTSFTISNFPFLHATKNTSIQNLNIAKSGGGLVYFTAYQKVHSKNPMPKESDFIVNTSFEKNGQKIINIKSGERIKMVISVDVLKDAEFIMLQAPIPAVCLYANKLSYSNGVFREFLKDKVSMFIEDLPKGKHYFEIELEPRYNGTYTINPTKVELMYYPTFYGNNEMKNIKIVGE